jgi:hypothetical protein
MTDQLYVVASVFRQQKAYGSVIASVLRETIYQSERMIASAAKGAASQ